MLNYTPVKDRPTIGYKIVVNKDQGSVKIVNEPDKGEGVATVCTSGTTGAPSCGMARPGGGIDPADTTLVAATARMGDVAVAAGVSPNADDKVAAADVSVGFNKAERPATKMINRKRLIFQLFTFTSY